MLLSRTVDSNNPRTSALFPPGCGCAAAVTTQFATVLRLASLAPIRRDQLNVVLFDECFVELVRVVGLVADEPGREFVEEASCKNPLHKLALGW